MCSEVYMLLILFRLDRGQGGVRQNDFRSLQKCSLPLRNAGSKKLFVWLSNFSPGGTHISYPNSLQESSSIFLGQKVVFLGSLWFCNCGVCVEGLWIYFSYMFLKRPTPLHGFPSPLPWASLGLKQLALSSQHRPSQPCMSKQGSMQTQALGTFWPQALLSPENGGLFTCAHGFPTPQHEGGMQQYPPLSTAAARKRGRSGQVGE